MQNEFPFFCMWLFLGQCFKMTEELWNPALCITVLLKIPIKEGWVWLVTSRHLRTVLIGKGLLYWPTKSSYNRFDDCCVPNSVQYI